MLAKEAGYSVFHFYRMFSSAVGWSVSGYLLGRRLKSALREIANGRKAIDVVLEYGFETYAGFYKAFVRTYGCAPKKYIALYGCPAEEVQKMEVKTMELTRTQIRAILSNWDIDPNLTIHDVTVMAGQKIADDIWRIGEDYFLRIRADRAKQLKNIEVAKALAKQGLDAALPVPTKTGAEYIDGETLSILTYRVKGMELESEKRYGKRYLEFAKTYGQALAKLHQALLSVEESVVCDEADIVKTVTEWALPNLRKQNQQWSMGLSEEFFTDFIDRVGVLKKLPRQLIHRDAHPGNVLFYQDEVSGFIDFEFSERNIRLFDPCYCATGLLSETEDDAAKYEKWWGIFKGILHGYDELNPLTAEEKESVFYVLCSIQMICVVYFAEIDDRDFQRLAKTNRKMLQFIVENKARVQEVF